MNLQDFIKQRKVKFEKNYGRNGLFPVFQGIDEERMVDDFHSQTIKGIIERVEKMCEEEINDWKKPEGRTMTNIAGGAVSALSTLLEQLSEVKKNI